MPVAIFSPKNHDSEQKTGYNYTDTVANKQLLFLYTRRKKNWLQLKEEQHVFNVMEFTRYANAVHRDRH